MLTTFAYLTLALGFLLSIYGLIAVIWGLVNKSAPWIESARLALMIIFPLVTVSLIVLILMLLNNRFDVTYVYSVTSRDMPAYLKLTALWGGQSGSLLFWSWLLAGFSSFFSWRKNWRKDKDLMPWAMLVVFLCLAFFLSLNVFFENPFERFWHIMEGGQVISVIQPPGAFSLSPRDGQGLNPLLRHPGMIWHPPALYLGFVGFIIPFALAMATLASGRKDQRWIEIARPWTLIAWVFLSLGLVLGMRWAYDVLGWGGYWGWDPVEIAALMPWLSGTAFLHTALLQKKHQRFRRLNMVLVILTFGLIIFGTFITRSGVLSSVHSFADSKVGEPMFFFMAVIVLGALSLLFYRWGSYGGGQEIAFKFSREVLTLFTTLILLSILLVCFLGVIYPVISELLTGNQVTVGPAWYERILGPLFVLLLLLMGVCPLAFWGGNSLKRLGKGLWWLIGASIIIPLLAWLLGDMDDLYALITLWFVSLGILVILAEYIRDVRSSQKCNTKQGLSTFWTPLVRKNRRYGAFFVHLGIILMSIGIVGLEGLQQETQVTLDIGESASLSGYQFTFNDLENFNREDGVNVSQASLSVAKDGRAVTNLTPQRHIYFDMGLAITQPSVKSNLVKDIYAILVEFTSGTQNQATFRLYVTPLVNWLWIGVGVLTLGAIVAVLPSSRKKQESHS